MLPQVASGNPSALTAAELAERLKFYRSVHEFSVEFQETKHLKDMGLDLKSEGRLEVAPPDRVIWQIRKPSPLTVRIDTKRVEIVSGVGKEESRQEVKLDDISGDRRGGGIGSILPWLTLDAERLTADYRVTQIDDQDFRFESRTRPEKIELRLGKGGVLRRLRLFESSGDSIELSFDNPVVKRR